MHWINTPNNTTAATPSLSLQHLPPLFLSLPFNPYYTFSCVCVCVCDSVFLPAPPLINQRPSADGTAVKKPI
jgi:hypothetical protein